MTTLAGRVAVRVRTQLADPLLRNAYALMLNTALTGVLGLGYWLLAARRYSPVDVGRASAAFAAMNLLAGLTALSLTGSLTRFLPQSGRGTGTLIARTYLVSIVVSAAGAGLFLLGAGRFGASFSELTGLLAGLAFVASVVAWAVFTLQDGVLMGLRSASWLPAENGLFGAAKIILLVAVATALPHGGIYLSWMLPVFVSLPLVNALIFRKIVPAHARSTGHRERPTGRQIGRFLAGDYTGTVCMLATANLVPVVVALLAGPGMTAYFYIAWTVGATLDLLGINLATSLTVEGAFDAGRLGAHCRAALRRVLLILVPVAAGLALLSSWILGFFGPGYARYGAPVLILLAAATLPRAVTELYLGALRAQSRTALVARIQAARGVLVLGGVLALTRLLGPLGAALAVLAGQALVAAVIGGPGLWRIRSGRSPGGRRQRDHALPGGAR